MPVALLMGDEPDATRMTAPRRGFLAYVGSALVSGAVVTAAAGTRPTLILPPAGVVPLPRWPLLAAEETQMDAILRVGIHLPRDLHRDWLEAGLRQARPYEAGYDQAAEERRIMTAVKKHGSMVEAIQAGALR